MPNTDDLRITDTLELSTPQQVIDEIPVSDAASAVVTGARQGVRRVLAGEDDRLVVVVGPCSIHDTQAALEYARTLQPLIERYQDSLQIIMRVYFEKPRTTVGWKGLINDPDLDDSYDINRGLRMARTLLRDLNEMGVPAGTEYLDLISPQYIADLVGWGAIGARTTESQSHRELASGLSCPVGFKNATSGGMQIAVDAIGSSVRPHRFLSVTKAGRSAIFQTQGNSDCHVILRGGSSHVNYDAASVDDTAALLAKAGLPERVMIDFSHANSRKKHQRQAYVCRDVASQIEAGDARIFGVMIESHLVAGRQDVKPGEALTFGQSITDACIGWEDTERMLAQLSDAVLARRGQ